MNANVHRRSNRRKRRILRRIENKPGVERRQPMMTASNAHYQVADRTKAIASGGIGAVHLPALGLGLVRDIDEEVAEFDYRPVACETTYARIRRRTRSGSIRLRAIGGL